MTLTQRQMDEQLSSYCPRCETQLHKGGVLSLNAELAIVFACLILLVPLHVFPLITINLFDVDIPATLLDGVKQLFDSGSPLVAGLVFFCGSLAPTLFILITLAIHLSLKKEHFVIFSSAMRARKLLMPWVMIDVYLVSLAVSCFKIRDYASIQFDVALYALVTAQILLILLLSRTHNQRYWHAWAPLNHNEGRLSTSLVHCSNCELTQRITADCIRCKRKITKPNTLSLQRCWAYLITATCFLLPANLYPISILITNGQQLEDTILSGILSLIRSDMTFIAAIIFTASILVPLLKVIVLFYLLLCIHFKSQRWLLLRMKLHRIVHWIGKWSVLDLFVIAIMMTLLDRGQLLDFTPGPGAIAFAVVVVTTMLATEALDSRLFWIRHEQ